jgi:hypothetical protein
MDIRGMLATISSHAEELGVFERVNTNEPKNAPGNGLSCAVWVDRIAPLRSSGLPATTGLLTFNVRVYTSMTQEPVDLIDPAMTEATDLLLESYSGDFDLGDAQVRNIDLLGAYGSGLSAIAGYLNIDNKMYRIMTITLPVVINDLWAQEA